MPQTVTVTDNLKDLNRALYSYARKFNVNMGKLVRNATLRILSDVQNAHPVDTGRSRAGWIPFIWSLGVEAPLKSAVTADPRDVMRAQREGIRACKYRYKFEGNSPYAWIQNRVYYEPYLEYGTKRMPRGSKQMPAGYVRKAIQNYANGIKSALKKVTSGESPE